MKKFALILLLSCFYSFSQNLKPGLVTIQDFEVKTEDISDDHDAILIFNSVDVVFVQFKQYRSVSKRIRIGSEEGLEYATQSIQLYQSENGKEKILDVSGATYNLINGKVEIDANPVLVSSVNNEIPIFPTREGFDYLVAQVSYGDKKELLDATEKYAPTNLLPVRATNWKGRLIKDYGTSESIRLTDNKLSEEIVLLNMKLDGETEATGYAQKRHTNYMALISRNRNVNSTEDELEKYIQSNNVDLEVSNVKVKDLEKADPNLNYTYDIKLKNAFNKVGDKIYITPLFYEFNEESPFKLETRKLPLDLSFSYKTRTTVNIEIPEGYEVESIPESIKAIYNDYVGCYKYVTSYQRNIISTVATFNLDVSITQPKDCPAFKKFFEAIVEKDAQKIVLKKSKMSIKTMASMVLTI